jgi:hypothetical protein
LTVRPQMKKLTSSVNRNVTEGPDGPLHIEYDQENCVLLVGERKSSFQTSTLKFEDLPLDNPISNSTSMKYRWPTPSKSSVSVLRIGFSMRCYPPLSTQNSGEECPGISPTGSIRKGPSFTYTTVQSEMGAQSRPLGEIDLDYFPHLDESLSRPDCRAPDIIFLEVNLALMGEQPVKGSRMGIDFRPEVSCGEAFHNWHVRTMFYEDHGKHSHEYTKSLRTSRIDAEKIRLEEIPLESAYWVNVFQGILARRTSATAKEDMELERDGHAQW